MPELTKLKTFSIIDKIDPSTDFQKHFFYVNWCMLFFPEANFESSDAIFIFHFSRVCDRNLISF